MEWLGRQIGCRRYSDWYQVASSDITGRGGATVLFLYEGSRFKLFSSVFPEAQWLPRLLSVTPRTLKAQIEQDHREMCDAYAAENNFASVDQVSDRTN